MKPGVRIKIPEQKALNMRLSEIEFVLGRAFVESMPRNIGLVIGNGCNIDCRHCYQVKSGDNLFRDTEIGLQLRRELMSLYPFLSTLRLIGGEVFALTGFRELIGDIATVVKRPIVSISTNGTLIDEDWARTLVETPFQCVTVSLDAGTAATFERLRRGAKFDEVINNIKRIQRIKKKECSGLPIIDSFFVVMRCNFREIPQFLELLEDLEIYQASFQTMLTDERNLSREPSLVDEVIKDEREVKELYGIVQSVLKDPRFQGMRLVWSGLTSVFQKHGLDAFFLREDEATLTPDQPSDQPLREADDLIFPEYEMPPLPDLPEKARHCVEKPHLCTNPWYTMMIGENGDVSLCFLSHPIGNLYETPLIELWNCPAAVAKRSRMLAGRCTESGCSSLWCDWRDGRVEDPPDVDTWVELAKLFEQLTHRLQQLSPACESVPVDTKLGAVRRMLTEKNQRIAELEANLSTMWDDNGTLHRAGTKQLRHLEARVAALEKELSRAKWGSALRSRLFGDD